MADLNMVFSLLQCAIDKMHERPLLWHSVTGGQHGRVWHYLNKVTIVALGLPGWKDKGCYIIHASYSLLQHHLHTGPIYRPHILHLRALKLSIQPDGNMFTTETCLVGTYTHTHTHSQTLHSCCPCDSSSKGYRWLHFVQAYRADVAILSPTTKSHRVYAGYQTPAANRLS